MIHDPKLARVPVIDMPLNGYFPGFVVARPGTKVRSAMNLEDILDTVNSRETFLAFVRALAADKRDETNKERETPSNPWGPGANGWEHDSVEDYLEAALTWGESTSAEYNTRSLPEEPSWKAFAEFLYCGKIYE
jgi:hypothetical protein